MFTKAKTFIFILILNKNELFKGYKFLHFHYVISRKLKRYFFEGARVTDTLTIDPEAEFKALAFLNDISINFNETEAVL
jgi:hypothetical protein